MLKQMNVDNLLKINKKKYKNKLMKQIKKQMKIENLLEINKMKLINI